MQHRAAAALAMGVDQRRDRRDNARMCQRLGDEAALPQVIFGERPVLHGAAAALREVLADRRNALVARLVDTIETAAVGVAGDRFGRHRFARQRIGHIDRAVGRVGDAVAAVAEAGDGQSLSHG